MKLSNLQQQFKFNEPSSNNLRPIVLAISIALTGFTSNISHAATYVVTNTNDSGAGSLREAILNSNASIDDDTILFDPSLKGSTITLSSGVLFVEAKNPASGTGYVTITGPTEGDHSSITIDANQSSRVFSVNDDDPFNAFLFAELTLENMTIKGGLPRVETGNLARVGGGGIYSEVPLVLNNTLITNNKTTQDFHRGGGIFSKEKITLNNSIVSDNSTLGQSSSGGGALSNFNLTVNNSVITRNTTSGMYSSGGGLHGRVDLKNSTVSDNSTTGKNSPGGGIFSRNVFSSKKSTISGNTTSGEFSMGGGVFADTSQNFVSHRLEINQSTISGNKALGLNSQAGGIFLSLDNDFKIIQSTITENTSSAGAGGIDTYTYYGAARKITLTNTILSNNSGPKDNFDGYGASILDSTYSLFGDLATEINGTNVNTIATNVPDLGPLQDNGGPTLSHLPTGISLAIDNGNNDVAANFVNDQRGAGLLRVRNNRVDIGAIEIQVGSYTNTFDYDIDGNQEIAPLTDGLLVLRYFFGFRGEALIANAIGTNPIRNNIEEIETYLQTAIDNRALDIDGNGVVQPLTDGLLLLRYQFGFRGNALIQNAIGDNATRNTAADIESFLQ